MKVAAPSTGITRLTSGTDSGAAISVPAAQISSACRRRSARAPLRPSRRIAAIMKYSRPSRKPLTAQNTTGNSGPANT